MVLLWHLSEEPFWVPDGPFVFRRADEHHQLLTFTRVRQLQVLVRADTRVPKHRVVHSDDTAVPPAAAVEAETC